MDRPNYHLAFATIIELAEGRVAATNVEQAHLAMCVDCAATLAWLQRVITLMRETNEEPPAHTVAAVKRMFRQRFPERRRIFPARLLFDSARMAPSFAVRAGAAYERQLLFSIESYDLDLRIAPHGALWLLSGQLLGNPAFTAGSAVIELHGAETLVRAPLSDLAEFVLDPVPAGVYSLQVQTDDLAFDIQDLAVGT